MLRNPTRIQRPGEFRSPPEAESGTVSDQQITVQVAAAGPIYRRGIAAVLLEDGIDVVASAADGDELAGAEAADVTVAQLELPGLAAAMRERTARGARGRIVLLLASAEPEVTTSALRHGPAALLLHDAGPDELLSAVRAVAAGSGWISGGLVSTVLGQARSGAVRESIARTASGSLSPREREVLVLVAAGHSNRAVAAELFIAENTVKNHVRHILAKLELSSRVEATLYAVSTGLIDSADPR